jgi:hypothetical protein
MLTPAVSVIGSLIGIYLKVHQQNVDWWIVYAFFGGLVLCAFVASYYTHIKPLRDPAANGRLLLDTIGTRIVKYGKDKGLPLRLNMLLIYRPLKRFFFSKYLRVRWGLQMTFDPDGAVEFHIKKGVAGEALTNGRPKLVNMEEPENKGNWGFTEKELRKFPPHTMIWSYPLFQLDKLGDNTGKLLGTVNLDSIFPGACEIVLKDPEFAKLMEEFRDIACKIASC